MPLEIAYARHADRTRTTTIKLVNGRTVDMPGDVRAEEIAAVLKRRRDRRLSSIETDLGSPAAVRLDAPQRSDDGRDEAWYRTWRKSHQIEADAVKGIAADRICRAFGGRVR